MRKKISRIIIAVEIVLLGIALLGLGWVFIAFRVPKEIEWPKEKKIVEEGPEIKEDLITPEILEERLATFLPDRSKIVVKKRVSPPPGLPQTPAEEKKFMEEMVNPPEPEGKERKEEEKIEGELPLAF